MPLSQSAILATKSPIFRQRQILEGYRKGEARASPPGADGVRSRVTGRE